MDEGTKNMIRAAVRPLSGKKRREAVERWAAELSCSTDTIYRWCRTGSISARKRRRDAGVRRAPVADSAKQKMFSLSIVDGYSAQEVIDYALSHEWISEPISVSQYNAWRRQDGVPARALTPPGKLPGALYRSRLKEQPHRRFEAASSNEIHQIDLTELKRYFIAETGNTIAFEPDKGPNREDNGLPRLQLATIIDDHSRCLYADLFHAKDTDTWMDFVVAAWEKKQGGLYGVPSILYGDKDGSPRATRFTEFLGDMGCEYIPHLPGNSAAKGKVESGAIRYLKRRMSNSLMSYYRRGEAVSLGEARDLLRKIVDEKNARTHSVTGEAPLERFSRGLKSVRLLPDRDDLAVYYYTTVERRVYADLTIRLNGVQYQLPPEEPHLSLVGQRVTVRYSDHPERSHLLIVVVDGDPHPVPAKVAIPDEAGNIRSLPTAKAVEHIKAAYETDIGAFDPVKMYEPQPETAPIAPIPMPAPEPEMTKIEVKSRLLREGYRPLIGQVDDVFLGRDTITLKEYRELTGT